MRDRHASVNLTLARESKIHERSKSFAAKLKTFRRHQNVHMPGVADLVQADAESIVGPRLPEDTPLFLPSECHIDGERILGLCADGLYTVEAALRRGRCSDAIMRLRGRLMARRHFVNYRNAHITGQNQSTRAAKLIQSLGERVNEAAEQYRAGRKALLMLVGKDGMEGFKELQPPDIDLVQMEENDASATKKLGRLGGRGGRVTGTQKSKQGQSSGESRRVISWIWSFGGGPDASSEEYLHECRSFIVGEDDSLTNSSKVCESSGRRRWPERHVGRRRLRFCGRR